MLALRLRVHLEADGGGEGEAVEGSDHIQWRGVDADIQVVRVRGEV